MTFISEWLVTLLYGVAFKEAGQVLMIHIWAGVFVSFKVDLIHFEFNNLNVVSRTFFKDFWEFLPNYDLYRMVRDGLVHIKIYDPVHCEIFAYQNIVAKLKPQFVKSLES